MKRSAIIEIICFLFILLFVYAASSKLLEFEKFETQIGQSPLLFKIKGWVAWMIPLLELMIAIALAIPSIRLKGLYAAFTLMAMFTAYIFTITQFSEYIPCSCGGILSHMGWNTHLIFNSCYIVMAAIAIVLETNLCQNELVKQPTV